MYTVTRSGTLKTQRKTPNQCNHEGCTEYKYTVEATTGDRLNADTGFALDHRHIDRIAQAVMINWVASCELMALAIADNIAKFCEHEGINLLAISVQIRPISNEAYVTYKKLTEYLHGTDPNIKATV